MTNEIKKYTISALLNLRPKMLDQNLLAKFKIPSDTSLEEIKQLLVEKEKTIIQSFFGKSNIAWENDLSGMQALKIKPWLSTEMSSYYYSREDSEEIKKVLAERRIEIAAGHIISNYDDYQLLRDAHNKEQRHESKHLSDNLAQLFFLGELFVQANSDTQEVNKDTYYLSVLLRVLDILREELSAHDKTNSPKPILLRIDAVNHLLANHLLNIIISKQVDKHTELLDQTFKAIGSMDQEVLPWLAVFFKRELLKSNEDQDQLIEEFFKLSNIICPKSSEQLLLEMGGQELKPAINKTLSEYFKLEGKIWYGIESLSLESKLQKIEAYLLNSHLSDWVMSNICMDLVSEAKKQPNHTELSRVLYLCCQRVYQDQSYLEQAHDYLNVVNHDIGEKQFPLPAVSVAATANINTAVEKAFELGVIPPSAKIFYEMIKEADKFAKIASTYDKSSLIKILSTIFIDGNQLEQHLSFIDSELAKKINLDANDFPLMALRKHYADPNSKSDPVQLWETVLDAGIIMQSTFLASAKNEALFENLQQLASQLISPDKILKYPERYRELSLALAVYCTLHTQAFDGFIFTLPRLEREESAVWASKLFMAITNLLPRNVEQKFEFGKALALLEMTIDPPNQIYIKQQNLASACSVAVLDANAHQTSINSTYNLELLRGMFINYVNERSEMPLTKTQMNQMDMLPLCHLPAQLFQIIGSTNLGSSTAIPEFLPYPKKVKLLKTIATQQTMKTAFDSINSLMNSVANIFSENRNPQQERDDKRNNQKAKETFIFIQAYLEYCQQELAQNNQLEDAEKRAYNNYIQYWTNPLVAKICNTAAAMTQYLEKQNFSDDLEKANHWQLLRDNISRFFLDFTDATKVQSLIISVNQLIDAHSGEYAKLLKKIRDELRALEIYAKQQRPETVSKYDEEKCFQALKTIKAQCELYKKHLTSITQEEKHTDNVKRIQRANDKLADFQGMLEFDENQNHSEQLLAFNSKSQLFKQKYTNPDPDAAIEKANRQFWRRIAYAFLTAGIYAIVRGTHLGTCQFWKSHKAVFSETVEKTAPVIR